MEPDTNYDRLQCFNRIHKLTSAVDALVARDYIAQQRELMLADLEVCVEALAKEVTVLEESAEKTRQQCALLQPTPSSSRVAVSGEDSEVLAFWDAHGDVMVQQLAEYVERIADIEAVLAEEAVRLPTSSNSTRSGHN